MKTILALAAIILVIGCSDETYDIPPELEPYVSEFVKQAEAHGIDANNLRRRLTIRYEDGIFQKGRAGYSHNPGFTRLGHITITLDTEYIKYNVKWNPKRPYALIFHELGHGFLGRDHEQKGVRSLMNPDWCQTDDWESFVDELFQKTKLN